MNNKNDEYYNKEFPNSFNDFLYLARPFTEEEIMLAEKEALIKLCVVLKQKELEYYNERNQLRIKYDDVLDRLTSLVAKMNNFKNSD